MMLAASPPKIRFTKAKRLHHKGVTLVEMAVVIAVSAIIFLTLAMGVYDWARNMAETSEAVNQEREEDLLVQTAGQVGDCAFMAWQQNYPPPQNASGLLTEFNNCLPGHRRRHIWAELTRSATNDPATVEYKVGWCTSVPTVAEESCPAANERAFNRESGSTPQCFELWSNPATDLNPGSCGITSP